MMRAVRASILSERRGEVAGRRNVAKEGRKVSETEPRPRSESRRTSNLGDRLRINEQTDRIILLRLGDESSVLPVDDLQSAILDQLAPAGNVHREKELSLLDWGRKVVADGIKVDERLVQGGRPAAWQSVSRGTRQQRKEIERATDLMNFSVRRSLMMRLAGSSASMMGYSC